MLQANPTHGFSLGGRRWFGGEREVVFVGCERLQQARAGVFVVAQEGGELADAAVGAEALAFFEGDAVVL